MSDPAIKKVERLLGIPDPRLIWNKNSTDSWISQYEKFGILIYKGSTLGKPNHNYRWSIRHIKVGGFKSLLDGSGHCLKEAKKGATRGLRTLL